MLYLCPMLLYISQKALTQKLTDKMVIVYYILDGKCFSWLVSEDASIW